MITISVLRMILPAILILGAPLAIADCTVDLNSADVMKTLEASGTMPSLHGENCIYDNPTSTFEAGPIESCVVDFNNNALLAQNWSFIRISGQGGFQASISPNGIKITIDPSHGFKPKTFSLKYATNKTDADCRKMSQVVSDVIK
ncbi:hypothetical protein [Burkholderia ubonensis]|uniref:hypothetical protein n=1 Tax=Burkholderia ubonensis TaxID=101571 RepID=UPI0012F85401|nr:hypothetical protein [Burkholderia ubonensis]